jgi:hypothetical protein
MNNKVSSAFFLNHNNCKSLLVNSYSLLVPQVIEIQCFEKYYDDVYLNMTT